MQDLRFAVRSFLRTPWFTVPAVVALALGIVTAVVLALAAMLASYVPARRGTRVAHVEALRAE